eukprot:TRINITY_DN2574_c0_g1_i1.p1 TRINITY_DN2574_c0_g1~~TRINITY_DN2574_c0_g1_i1.p1  ORF type:complete len:186 (-),score=31.60 TRINITY_DN2574_c0_g1_i1:59-616(-)
MLIYSSCAFKWNRSRRISLFKRHQSDYQEVYRVERKSSHLSFRKTRELYFKANQAYKAGKLKKAEMYRMKAKDVFYEMRELEYSASERIFDRNNKKHTMDHIDLHGLYQKEAVHFLERRVEEIIGWLESRRKEKMELNIVTGWGKGSNGVSVLQVGVEKFLKDRDFSFKEVHRGKYHVVIKRRKS